MNPFTLVREDKRSRPPVYIKNILWLNLFFLIFCLPSDSFCQTERISFDYLGIKEGTPADGAFDIIQDRQGFVWMASLNGLVKYDGYDFSIYRARQENPSGSSQPVGRAFVSLLEANDGKIWASSLNSGFSYFDPASEAFTNFPLDEVNPSGEAFTRHDLVMEDQKGRIWMYEVNLSNRQARVKAYNSVEKEMLYFSRSHPFGKKIDFEGFMAEDSKGNIYCLNPDSGIFILKERQGEFASFLSCQIGDDSPLKCSRISHFRIDQEDKVWLSTNLGLFIYDLRKASWIDLGDIGFAGDSVAYSYADSKDMVWTFVRGKGLVSFDPVQQRTRIWSWTDSPLASIKGRGSDWIIKPVLEDSKGLWFINDVPQLAVFPRNFFHFDWRKGKLISYGEQFNQPLNKTNDAPVTFLMDKGGLMWIGNIGAGINRQNPIVSRIDKWEYTPNNSLGLSTDTILSVGEDSEKQIWISGKDNMQKFDEESLRFLSFTVPKSGPSSIIFNSFQDDGKGNLFIGSNKGLYKFSKGSGRFQLLMSLGKGEAYSMAPQFFDAEGNLWFTYVKKALGSEYGQALGVFDPVKGKLIKKFVHNPADPNSLTDDLILQCLLDSKDRVWLATFNGLGRYEPGSGNFVNYRHNPKDSSTISNNFLSFLMEDSRGQLWVGTFTEGLNRLDEEKGKFKRWKDKNGFLAILSATEGKDGSLWFGTYRGEGLFRMDPQTEELTYFNKDNGVASERILSITEDDYGHLWIPSESGLSYLDPSQNAFEVFNEEDGFAAYDDSDIPHYARPFKSSTGEVWFNSFTRLFRIQPDRLQNAGSLPPSIVLNELKVGSDIYQSSDGELLENHISQTDFLELSHDQNDLTFSFVGLHFARPVDNQYSYILENFDTEWSIPSTDRKVRYSGLPPGNYTFRVKAANADGIWTAEGASLTVKIRKAWWQTGWAFAFYFLVLGAMVWALVRWRTIKQTQKIKAQEEELKKEKELSERLKALDALKDQFLANTSHELRTPLNGIIGLSEGVYDRVEDVTDKEDLGLIISSGKRLHYLVDDILDFSKIKSADYELEMSPVNLNSVVELIFRMSKPSLGGKDLQLINSVPDQLPAVMVDPHRLQQILYNLVGNAIKFTDTGAVAVSAEQVGDRIKVMVSDTGIGIAPEQQQAIFEEFQQADGSISRKFGGTGLGLSITRQLVELHHGEIGVESAVNEGSTFWFTLGLSDKEGEKMELDGNQMTELTPKVHIEQNGTSNDEPLSVGTPVVTLTQSEEAPLLRILIVDDEPVNQRVIKNHLRDAQFELAFADDGDQALKIIASSPKFDLVLLDVMMPNMSGYEVCNKIREDYLPSELPVIMVTAKNQVNDLVEGLTKGANDYLAKPFSKQEFLARVKTQIDLHQIFDITDRFIPNEFIKTLGREKITEVQLGDLVERVVSVLFTDIRSYTTLSESMTPQDNFKFIRGYTKRMGPVIQENRGFVNQYLGDGIMAIFQYEADDALKSMIGMQEELRIYNKDRIAKGRPEIAVGMGLHTGPLIMGIIGDSRRTDAATISDTVNTAARMEGLTKGFGVRILISGATHRSLQDPDAYNLRYIGKVKVKGKNESVGVYECIDGDPSELKELKLQFKEKFDVAVTHYYGKQYRETIQIMEHIIEKNPGDKVARYFLDKSNEAILIEPSL